MKSLSHGVTDVGPARERNEDAFLIDESLGLFIVCDGMGGHAAGEVASRVACETAAAYLRHQFGSSGPTDVVQAAQHVVAAIEDANRRICGMASQTAAYLGMGTTITLAMIVDEFAVVGHVGDSRLYHVCAKKARQVTIDHTLAHELLQTGMCSQADIEKSKAQHMLTRSLGQEQDLIVDVLSFPLCIGDYLVLCTDGLANCIRTAGEMAVHVYGMPSEVSRRLVQLALDDDGSDNVTVLTLRVADHHPDVSPHLPFENASDSTIISS